MAVKRGQPALLTWQWLKYQDRSLVLEIAVLSYLPAISCQARHGMTSMQEG